MENTQKQREGTSSSSSFPVFGGVVDRVYQERTKKMRDWITFPRPAEFERKVTKLVSVFSIKFFFTQSLLWKKKFPFLKKKGEMRNDVKELSRTHTLCPTSFLTSGRKIKFKKTTQKLGINRGQSRWKENIVKHQQVTHAQAFLKI